MQKTVKILAAIVIVLFALWVIACVILSMIFTSSNLKRMVENATHHQVVINGHLGLGFFPNVHVNVSNMIIKNPAGFGDQAFATLYKASISLKLLPLLRKEIALNEISVNGVTVNLIKNANGEGNWQALAASFVKPSTTTPTNITASSTSTPSVPWKIQLPDISLRALNANFTDLKTGAHWSIEDAALMTEKIAFHDALSVTLQLKLKKPDNTLLPFSFSGELASDFSKTFHLNNIMLTLGPSHIQGDIDYDQDDKIFALVLSADELNLDTLLGSSSASSSEDTVAASNNTASTANKPATSQTIHIPSLDGLRIKAQVKIGRLIIHRVNLTNIELSAKNQGDQQILIDPMTADFYEGSINSAVLLDWQAAPFVKIDAKMDKANLQPLFADLTQVNSLKGIATFVIHLQAPVATGPAAIQGISGNGNANVSNMAWQGVDFAFIYQNALSLIQHQTLSNFSNTHQTVLGEMNAAFTIQNGIVNIQPLQSKSPILAIHGKISVNMLTQNTDGLVNVIAMQGDRNSSTPIGPEIPFSISGKIDDPSVQPQLGGLVTNVIQQAIPSNPGDLLKKLKLFQ